MPVFHTKTIESILEPVALQVSQLVILHEEAEDGNAMPDLYRPVQAVCAAVNNLVKVGRETAETSADKVLKQEMPLALNRVEEASGLLVDASGLLRDDPFSVPARKKLIDGARGILSGTSALLLAFDEAEVRKILRVCKSVLEYLAIAEVVESMEDLVTFVKNLTPGMTTMSKMIDQREKELTHQVHREKLVYSINSVKNLTPVLISGIKIFVTTKQTGGRGVGESQENRNYVVTKMSQEIHEIIRVLQLTTYDEEGWDVDDITVMKKAQAAIFGKGDLAKDWLSNPHAEPGGLGERSIRQIVDEARKVGARCEGPEKDEILRLCDDITVMTDQLAELRARGEGNTPQAQQLARAIQDRVDYLTGRVNSAVAHYAQSGIRKPAPTVSGKVEQAQQWLASPGVDDRGLGQQALRMVINEGRKVAEGCSGPERVRLHQLCDDCERLTNQLADLCARGQGNTPQAHAISRQLSSKLQELKDAIQQSLVNQVAEVFIDTTTPLKQFSAAAYAPPGAPNREAEFSNKAGSFDQHSSRLANTAQRVAEAGGCNDKRTVEAIHDRSQQVRDMTPQVIHAGRILLENPDNEERLRHDAAREHFEMLKKEWTGNMEKLTGLVDEATDTVSFIKATEEALKHDSNMVDGAIKNQDPAQIVSGASNMARRANRVFMVANQEVENSEDPNFVQKVSEASERMTQRISPLVINAKAVASNPSDRNAQDGWYNSDKHLIDAVGGVREAILMSQREKYPPPPPAPEPIPEEQFPGPPDMSQLHISEADLHRPLDRQLLHSSGQPGISADQLDASRREQMMQQPPSESGVSPSSSPSSKALNSRSQHSVSSPPPPPPPPPGPQVSSSPGPQVSSSPALSHQSLPASTTLPSTPLRQLNARTIPHSIPPQPSLVAAPFSGYKTTVQTCRVPPPPPPKPHQLPSTNQPGFEDFYKELDTVLDSVMNQGYETSTDGSYTPHGPPRPGHEIKPTRETFSVHATIPVRPPPRPPLPEQDCPPPRPPPPEDSTDDEMEVHFPKPQANQPIMTAAYSLHMEAQKWSSKGNEIVAAAKKMALLMAQMGRLVRGEGGSKKELIHCAKAIAKASEEVTRLAKEVAKQCTDKRMKLNLLQVCERIPTISTQLKILSTVKATMLGAQGSEEDQEATEMLVGNAQNLMQSVKETVRAAEAASIKIRTDSGYTLNWIRKRPWYQ
uniref:Vinculin n=1 Tax=Saccoglossus kowalevskii TaxID=10224 RepID=A0ABM0MCY9_SACKO|nr:PREDICTED: vinculin-like [Saccoglossus kowalevskii]